MMNNNTSQSVYQMTSYFSDKIRVVSFGAILMVFYIHAGFPHDVAETMKIPVVIRNCISGIWGPCAVPIFFSISGYLYFYRVKHIHTIFEKIKKRVRTIFIPFVIAALYFPLFFILMEFVPSSSSFINSESFSNRLQTMPISQIVVSLFYDYGEGYPWAYHLWFLRDLSIIILLSPCLYYLREWFKYWSILVPLLFYLIFPDCRLFNSMYWFLGGSILLDKLEKVNRSMLFLMFILFFGFSIAHFFYDNFYWRYVKIVYVSFGIISLWRFYDIVIPSTFCLSSIPILSFACQFTFFIYLYHEPVYHIIVKGIPLILGYNWFGYTMSYLLSPVLFTIIGVLIGYYMRLFLPNIYKVLVGGR